MNQSFMRKTALILSVTSFVCAGSALFAQDAERVTIARALVATNVLIREQRALVGQEVFDVFTINVLHNERLVADGIGLVLKKQFDRPPVEIFYFERSEVEPFCDALEVIADAKARPGVTRETLDYTALNGLGIGFFHRGNEKDQLSIRSSQWSFSIAATPDLLVRLAALVRQASSRPLSEQQ